jgi:hypothetical protein
MDNIKTFHQGLRLLMEYTPDKEAHFVKLYDKNIFSKEEPWLFNPLLVAQKTPEQLEQFFALPFTPCFMCDAIIQANSTVIKVYLTANSTKIYHAERSVMLSDERTLQGKIVVPTKG